MSSDFARISFAWLRDRLEVLEDDYCRRVGAKQYERELYEVQHQFDDITEDAPIVTIKPRASVAGIEETLRGTMGDYSNLTEIAEAIHTGITKIARRPSDFQP